MSPRTRAMPFQSPRNDLGTGPIGHNLATGFPCLVMTISVPVASTSSSSCAHRPLKSFAVMVLELDRSERNHARCVEMIESLTAPLVTCEAVIAEACYLLRNIPGASDAVLDNVEAGVFEIPFRLVGASRSIRLLMKRYARIPMDF